MRHLDEGTIHAWLDGALSAEESSAVEAHAAGCAECAALVAEARGLVAGASRILLGLDDVPAGVIPSGRTVPARARQRAARRWWSSGPAFRAAAAVLVIAGAGVVLTRGGAPDFIDEARRAPALEMIEPTASDAAATAPAPAPAPAAPVPVPPMTPSSARGATGAAATAPEPPAKAGHDAGGVRQELAPAAPPAVAETGQLRREMAIVRDTMPSVQGQQANISERAGAARAYVRVDAEEEFARQRLSQIVVEGRVTNAQTGAGLANAQASVEAAGMTTVTDSAGVFRLALPDTFRGTSVQVRARRMGFESVVQDVDLLGSTARVELALSASQMALQELVVTGAAAASPRADARISARGAAETPAESAPALSGAELEGCWAVSLGRWRPGAEPGAESLPSHLWLAASLVDVTADGPRNELRRTADSPAGPGSHWLIGAPDSVHMSWGDSAPRVLLHLHHRAGGLLRDVELRGIAVQGERRADVALRKVDAGRCTR